MATTSLSAVLGAVRRLVTAGVPPSPQLTLDELRRTGAVNQCVAKALQDATTAGSQPMAVRHYAAAAAAEGLRRRVNSVGVALTEAADIESEEQLVRLVKRGLASCVECAGRLAELRGDS